MKHVNVSLFVPHMGCPHKCIFCNQRTISGQTRPITREAIVSACRTAAACPHDKNNSEIAFFGGSFTAVEPDIMNMCLDAAAPFLESDFGGIRVSTRPDAIDDDVLALLRAKGVTAIELGAQSMCDDVLELNERGHTSQDTQKAVELIKKHGISVGLQMMTGLYGSSEEKDAITARRFIALAPDTVRIYPTVVLEDTKLCELYKKGEYTPPTLDGSVELCSRLLYEFESAGIKVIRLGLHSGGNVEQGFVAGAYHPAFRELCEGRLYRKAVEEGLSSLKKGNVAVTVKKGDASKAAGHGGCNKKYFKQLGYNIKIREREDIPSYLPEIREDRN